MDPSLFKMFIFRIHLFSYESVFSLTVNLSNPSLFKRVNLFSTFKTVKHDKLVAMLLVCFSNLDGFIYMDSTRRAHVI